MATVSAVCLGGAVAWATMGGFSVGAFLVVVVLAIGAQVGLQRLQPSLPWFVLLPLVFVAYWVQAGRLDAVALWPGLVLAVVWSYRLPVIMKTARLGNRGYIVTYALLLVGVVIGGTSVWCLLSLLPAPLAWRAYKLGDAAISEEWPAVTGMFLLVGYVIKGLIR